MELWNTVLTICGAISIVGGAGAIIFKVVKPAFNLEKRVKKLEHCSDTFCETSKGLQEMQKQQSKSLAAIINHLITGNGVENMKKIRDELLDSLIEK